MMKKITCTFMLLSILGAQSYAEQSIQQQAEALKQEVIALNRELYALESSLLYPVNTQVGFFLSIGTHNTFRLDSIDLKIDGNTATTYLYTDKEVKALENGGIQRLYTGNLSSGPHTIEVTFNGQDAEDHFFRRQKTFKFKKGDQAKNLELSLVDADFRKEPTIKLKTWD